MVTYLMIRHSTAFHGLTADLYFGIVGDTIINSSPACTAQLACTMKCHHSIQATWLRKKCIGLLWKTRNHDNNAATQTASTREREVGRLNTLRVNID